MQVYSGASGFSYAEWKGHFYPAQTRPKEMLSYYAGRLRTVELNASFYRLPSEAQFEAWGAAVPPGFVFSVKAPKRITHVLKLKGTEEPTMELFSRVRALGAALGPVLIQLPPESRADGELLVDFLELCQSCRRNLGAPELQIALEFRHPSWFAENYYDCLSRFGAGLVLGDPGEDAPVAAPPLLNTARSFVYARLRRTAPYLDEELARWARQLGTLGAEQLFVYFKHEVHAPEQARQFLEHFARG